MGYYTTKQKKLYIYAIFYIVLLYVLRNTLGSQNTTDMPNSTETPKIKTIQ